MRLKAIIIVFVVVLLSSLNGSNFFRFQAFGQQPQTLVVAMTGAPDPTVFNPIRQTQTYYASETFLGLVGWSSTGSYTPLLAKAWSISPDGLTETFWLRDGLKWSDGQPLTAQDVAWSFKVFAEQSNIWYYLFAPIEVPAPHTTTGYTIAPNGIETPNSTTVIFHLSRPSAPFFIYVGGNWILPEHVYKGFNFTAQNPDFSNYVGSGPFIPSSFTPGDELDMVANPYYYAGPPSLSKVIFKYYSSSASAEIALQTGAADYLQSVPPPDVQSLSSNPQISIAREESQSERYLMFNMMPTLPNNAPNPVSNLMVRKAIAYSLDLNTILNSTFGPGNYRLANQIQVPNMFYNNVSVTNYMIPSPEYPQNVTLANQLLDQAGYKIGPEGTRFTISLAAYNSGSATQTKLLQLIQSRLAAVGITLQIILYDATTFNQKVYGDTPPKSWNIAMGSLSSSPDADVACFYVVSGLAGNAGAGGWNAGSYNSTTINNLTLQEENTTDTAARVAIIQRISELVHEQLPVLMLYYDIEIIAYNKNFHGFQFGLGQPETDYWGALKPQSLAQVYVVPLSTSTAVTAASTTSGFSNNSMTYVGIVVVAIVLIGVVALVMRRPKQK